MRVPGYEQKVDRQVAPHTPQTAEAFGSIAANQTLQVGRGLESAANNFDHIAAQQANTEAFNAEAQAKKDWIAYSADLQKNRQGTGAAGVTKDVQKWWDENKAKYGAGKGGRSGRMIDAAIGRLQVQAMEQFKGFELRQGEIAADAAVQANVSASVSAIAANPSTDNIALQRAGMTAALHEHAAARGWPPEVLNDKLATAQSASTIAAFNTLLARDPKEAREFWAANRETVRGEMRDEIETRLKSSLASMEGTEAADTIWRDMGPKSDMAPVEIDKMAAAVREKFKDQPETLKAALQSLKERATEHNAAQAERAAHSTNEVMAIWNGTKSLDKVKRSQAWAALPAAQQTKIEEHITSQLHQAESRAYTREQRANASLQREVLELERGQRLLKQRGFARYLELSNPQRLAGMSDAQVQALLPDLGNDLTEHLVNKKRSLTSSDATRTATIDKQDFDAIAQEMGMRPFESGASEERKAQLGVMQYRVEQLIDMAQRQKKAPLDRQEKQALMRQEMAKQVLVGNWWGGGESKPVIALTPDEVAKVKVPPTDRAAISDAMRAMYERTKKPQYAPTEENLKRFYLLRQTPSAGLIPSTPDGK